MTLSNQQDDATAPSSSTVVDTTVPNKKVSARLKKDRETIEKIKSRPTTLNDVVFQSVPLESIPISRNDSDGSSRLVSVHGFPVQELTHKTLLAFCAHAGIQGYSHKSKKVVCDLIVAWRESQSMDVDQEDDTASTDSTISSNSNCVSNSNCGDDLSTVEAKKTKEAKNSDKTKNTDEAKNSDKTENTKEVKITKQAKNTEVKKLSMKREQNQGVEAGNYEDDYYDAIVGDVTSGFFNESLAKYHLGTKLPDGERYFVSTPITSSSTDGSLENTPTDHPLRAIAWVLDNAAPNTVIRVYCSSLTDPAAMDLLIHAGKTRTVQAILHHNQMTTKALNKFLDEFGNVSVKSLLECVEIRLANSATGPSSMVSMHQDSIISENYTTMGSYTLSELARTGSWESLLVTETFEKAKKHFDEIWKTLPNGQIEGCGDYPLLQAAPWGPRRLQRKKARAAQKADQQQQTNDRAANRMASASQRERVAASFF